ncbi:TPA: hypothetical protein EYM26_15205 [Candidatus Poribacteria bacterium]|nr:hypothetical protein [Candidatus Poribacteria bacterium]
MTSWRVGFDAKPTNGILPDKPTIARQKEYQHYSTGQPNTEFDFRRCFSKVESWDKALQATPNRARCLTFTGKEARI